VLEFIPLTVSTILLQPSQKARQEPTFNKEVYVDFVAVQIKFLSFLAYIIRIFQDQVCQGWGLKGCGFVMEGVWFCEVRVEGVWFCEVGVEGV